MLKKTLAWALGALLLSTVVSAQDPRIRADHPTTYTVQPGDTLWDISGHFLTEPWYWPEIWHENPDIENPHLIYPGDVVRLTLVNGEPRLHVERGGGTIKLSPEVRVEELDDAIPGIPMEAIRPFLSGDRVVDAGTLSNAPYVVAGGDERVMSAVGDPIYVRGLEGSDARTWDVVRKEQTFRDPASGEVLGVLARYAGSARVRERGDPATLVLTDSTREVLAGDRLLEASDDPFDSQLVPSAPSRDVEGVILAVMDGVNQIGQYDVVALNLGEREGMKTGHVLTVFEKPRRVKDPYSEDDRMVTLPAEREGVLIVFQVFDRVSLGLVMEANRAIAVGDTVRTPEQ